MTDCHFTTFNSDDHPYFFVACTNHDASPRYLNTEMCWQRAEEVVPDEVARYRVEMEAEREKKNPTITELSPRIVLIQRAVENPKEFCPRGRSGFELESRYQWVARAVDIALKEEAE